MIRFRDKDYKRLRRIQAEGAPEFSEIALFQIPKEASFDPTEPWRIELLVGRETGPTSKAFTTFDLNYRLPARFLKVEEQPRVSEVETPHQETQGPATVAAARYGDGPPLWQRLWQQKRAEVFILGLSVAFLTGINWLSCRDVRSGRNEALHSLTGLAEPAVRRAARRILGHSYGNIEVIGSALSPLKQREFSSAS